MDPNSVRVMPASALRNTPRLHTLAKTDSLSPLEWNLVARSSDDKTLIFNIDLGKQRAQKIAGVQVEESPSSISVSIFGILFETELDRMPYSLSGQFLVDIDSTIAGRNLVNPSRP